MRSTLQLPLISLNVILPALLWSGTAVAAPEVRTDAGASANARFGAPGTGVSDPHSKTSFTGASLVVSSFAQQGASTGSSSAAADLGALHAQAFATFPSFITGDAAGGASASWSDGFTISVPGHAGETATFQVPVILHGTLDSSGDGVASVRVQGFVNSANALFYQATFDHNGLHDGSGNTSLKNMLTFSGSFIVGTPFQVRMDLVAGVSSLTGDTPGSGDSLFADTAFWGGLSSIKLNGGATITTFTLDSLSGLDYTKSFATVPEPGTALLGLGGLALLCGRRGGRSGRVGRGGYPGGAA
jgi:hypothetical protein